MAQAIGGARTGRARAGLGWPVAFVVLTAAALWIGWIGFIASDDALYYDAATHWLTAPPFAGDSHWATRFPVVLSFTATLAIFGRGLLAFDIVALFWYGILVALIGAMAARMAGARAGWIAAILAATLPVITTNASIVNCDLPEVVFLLGGAWLLLEARTPRGAVVAGLCFGLAMLCRETAILALAGLAIIFLVGRPVPRGFVIAAGVGALLILGGEALFQYLLTGDPLHRYGLAAHHDAHIDRPANLEGNFLVHPVIDPLLVLLINNEFGLLFWVGAAAIVTGALRNAGPFERRLLAIVAAMAFSAFMLVSVLYHFLVLNPRYFTLVAIVMLLIVAGWLSRLRERTAIVIIAIVTVLNLLMLGLANGHPHWPSDAVALAARDHRSDIILADRDAVGRSGLRLMFDGNSNVTALPSAPWTLRLVEAPSPPPGAIAAYPSPPTRIGAIIGAIGLSGMIPERLRGRIMAPNKPLFLVPRPRAEPTA